MINIIYEDNHLLVVEKPINIPSQKDASNDKDMLTLLKEYIKDKANKPGDVYLGLVHRLDRPAGGLMVFAKTSKAASRLTKEMKEHNIKKIYNSIIEGDLKDSDTFIDYLVKDGKTNTSKVTLDKELGKEAILHYQVIKRVGNLNLVEINLETGRPHQIRVQFASRNLALLGDQRYNKKATKKDQLSLYSVKLEFLHPTTKELMSFSINLPNTYPWNLFK